MRWRQQLISFTQFADYSGSLPKSWFKPDLWFVQSGANLGGLLTVNIKVM